MEEFNKLYEDHWSRGVLPRGDYPGLGIVGLLRKGILWFMGAEKIVPREIEEWVESEASADQDVAVLTGDTDAVSEKPGVCMRIAEEVRMRFGMTPQLTQSNLLLAGRYIRDALEDSRVRKVDRPKVFYKIRALVFTRSRYEMEEDQILNSASATKRHSDGTGWASVVWKGLIPDITRRKVGPQ